MLKILHCADIHLDMPFTSLGADGDRSSLRRQDLKEVFERIIHLVKEEEVDLLLISGDLYEHNYVRKSTIHFINDKFSQIPDTQVFLISGNHDPYILNSYYHTMNWNRNVHILTSDNPFRQLSDLGVCVYGAGFENFYEDGLLLDKLRPQDPSLINILLAHGTVDMDIGSGKPGNKGYNQMSSAVLAALGMDYIALGHFHNRIDQVSGCSNIYNPGSPEPLGFDEAGEHGVYLCSIEKRESGERKLEVNFIKTGKRFYKSLDIMIDGCSTNEQVIEKVAAAIRGQDVSNGLFDVRLKGYVAQGFRTNKKQLQGYFKDKVFFMKFTDETQEDYDLDKLAAEPGLRGQFVRKMLAMMDAAEDEHRNMLLTRALYYGLQALEEGKVEIGG